MFQGRTLYAIALMAVAALGLVVLTLQPTNQQTPTTSSFASDSSFWQVVKSNVTVSDDAACMVLEADGHSCPTRSGASSSSLRGVELVAYQGRDYYAGNFSAGPYGPGPFVNGRPVVASRMIWFTNSTIFCVSPSFGNYVACPSLPPLPPALW